MGASHDTVDPHAKDDQGRCIACTAKYFKTLRDLMKFKVKDVCKCEHKEALIDKFDTALQGLDTMDQLAEPFGECTDCARSCLVALSFLFNIIENYSENETVAFAQVLFSLIAFENE